MTEQQSTLPDPKFRPDGTQYRWSANSISAAETCLRKYKYTQLDGWRHKNKSVHLIFGGIYAAALEQYYKHTFAGVPPDEALANVVRAALLETWSHERDESNTRIPDTGEPWDSMHAAKSRETLIRSIIWYFDHFANDTTTTVELADGSPAVEYEFSLPMEGDIILYGKLDQLVTYGDDRYVMDQKTSGQTVTARYFEAYTPDIQMSSYTWAGQIAFNLPIKGVILDVAQIAVGFTRFERGFIHRTQSQLDEWYESSAYTIERATQATVDNYFPMNRTSCGNYGGCEFRSICSRMPKHRQALLEVNFSRTERG